MNKAELVERAKRRLNAGAPEPHIWPSNEIELGACVNDAMHLLSASVVMDNNRRSWLQQNYTVALDGNGESTDLLTTVGSVTGEVGEIILDGIYFGVVRDADSNVLQPLFHYADFLKPQATVYAYYTLKNQILATRRKDTQVNSPADIQSVTGPLTVTANYTPKNVDDVPLTLEDELVDHLCEVVLRKINANAS